MGLCLHSISPNSHVGDPGGDNAIYHWLAEQVRGFHSKSGRSWKQDHRKFG